MARYQAVFFDAGYTLLQMDPSWEGLFLQVTAANGVALTPAEAALADRAGQAYFNHHYYRPNETWTDDAGVRAFWTGYYRAGLHAAGCPPERVEPCAQALAHVLEQGSSWRPYDEVQAVLEKLRAAGYTIGILSDWGASLPAILEASGLRRLADFLVVSAIDGVAKPRAAFFQRALQRAGLLPHQALMVGDSLYADIQGAAAAGIAGVLLDRRGRHPDAGVPAIRTLDELWPHLDGNGQD